MAQSQEPQFFDYGLDAAQEERARRLHDESIIIDMLYQGPVGSAAYTEDMTKQIIDDYEKDHDAWRNIVDMAIGLPIRMAVRGEFPAFKEWWNASGLTAGNRQIRCFNPGLEEAVLTAAVGTLQFDRFDWLIKATSADDIRRAKAEGKHAGFFSTQHIGFLGQDLDNIDMFYELGLNMVQLTYNSMNLVAAGCTERSDIGVSHFGVRFIERLNKLGIIVDTGHCGRQTTLDACEISDQPVIASHSFAQGVFNHDRGKSDQELEALAKSGGAIGVMTVPFFLSAAAEVTMEHFLDHIDYIVRLIGHTHVGIGTDWPMSLPEWGVNKLIEKILPTLGFRPEHFCSAARMEGFMDYREFINITRGLVSRGYSDEQIKDILGGNFLRIMDAVWK